MKFISLCCLFLPLIASCSSQSAQNHFPETKSQAETITEKQILPGIYAMDSIVAALLGKRVALIANHTSLVDGTHAVDTLLGSGINVVKVFASEHGFRGDAPDGAHIGNTKDPKTGLPIVSLYGKNKKPTPEMLKDVDVIVFDIQDVGCRFYTFLSTMHYAMEAAAENGLEMVVLDRPNPNGFYVDGPVLDPKFKSFVGMHPIPVVYGMTLGECAKMINGEGWLKDGVTADLKVFECENYTHSSLYELPVKPSPNLPNMDAIYWYPSLCFLEGTDVSVGRGTPTPFTIIGEPGNKGGDFEFTPVSIENASTDPKHKGEVCVGYDLSGKLDFKNLPDTVQISWLVRMYNETDSKADFFRKDGYFDLLAGTDALRKALVAGKTANEIRAEWQKDLLDFKKIRVKYLIYAD
ncbi:exo-beta-N-acetylmuramidase NamZ family protein [Cryomorpha ignava]|nr:DUF1343 domain-containing protein [Cryomorpha ignava]